MNKSSPTMSVHHIYLIDLLFPGLFWDKNGNIRGRYSSLPISTYTYFDIERIIILNKIIKNGKGLNLNMSKVVLDHALTILITVGTKLKEAGNNEQSPLIN